MKTARQKGERNSKWMQVREGAKPLLKTLEGNRTNNTIVYSPRKHFALSWSNCGTTLILVLVFHQIAAPFRRKLHNDSIKTTSSAYFYINAAMYGWLLSSIFLTIISQFGDHYNEIVAAALFFPMLFATIGSVLFGRLVVRFVHAAFRSKIIHPFWKNSFSLIQNNNPIVDGATPLTSNPSSTASNGSDSSVWSDPALWRKDKSFPMVPFYRPFRKVLGMSFLLTIALCLLYADCWSSDIGAFRLNSDAYDAGGNICNALFAPFAFSSHFSRREYGLTTDEAVIGVEENAIWFIWFAAIVSTIVFYAQDEFAGKHSLHKNHHRHVVAETPPMATIPKEIHSLSPDAQTKMRRSRSNQNLNRVEIESDDESLSWVEKSEVSVSYNETDSEDEDDDDDIGLIDNIQQSLRKMGSTVIDSGTNEEESPRGALAMVPWYSILLLDSVFDILVQLKLFVGRFDARTMQPALSNTIAVPSKKSRSPTSKQKEDDNANFEDFIKSNPGCVFDYRHRECDGEKDGFWIDFMADCGDGFNSSYQVARMLAQPSLRTKFGTNSKRLLPRGQLLVIGGDLCYPDPTVHNFEKRFFRTFEDAMQPPPSFRRSAISLDKPELPVPGWNEEECFAKKKYEKGEKYESNEAIHEVESYRGPSTFVIPGNHDWYDGLANYNRFILGRNWLGGWLMPQQRSYFALALPKGWWMFGFDLGLSADIDIDQFKFFARIAAKLVQPSDAVIIVVHEPSWVIEADDNAVGRDEENLRELMDHHLKGKVRLRLAGDLHHYTRHVPVRGKNSKNSKQFGPLKRSFSLPRSTSTDGLSSMVTDHCVDDPHALPELVVSGGGGAFLHGTHTFSTNIRVGKNRDKYVRVCAYPTEKVSRRIAWLNIWQFRWRNWRLDVVWAVFYFCLASSLFPLCGVYADYCEAKTDDPIDTLAWVTNMLGLLFKEVITSGRVSLVFAFLISVSLYCLTDSHMSATTRALWGLTHGLIHIFAALSCLLFIECIIEYGIKNSIVKVSIPDDDYIVQGGNATDLASSLYEEYTEHFSHIFRNVTIFGLLENPDDNNSLSAPELLHELNLTQQVHFAIVYALKTLSRIPLLSTTLSLFDLPGLIAQKHTDICSALHEEGIPMIFGGQIPVNRITLTLYLVSVSLYFIVLAIPLAGSIFGTWLALTLNVFNAQYNGGFSSLRIQHWKNFVKLQIKDNGDLEIYGIGLDRVPKHWILDERWDGSDQAKKRRERRKRCSRGGMLSAHDDDDSPSWTWRRPSKWVPQRKTNKHIPQVIDYTCISKRGKYANGRAEKAKCHRRGRSFDNSVHGVA
mmetsp:Transcript_27634/g.42846  ORF Transcript_27634/g.42846 Transcript_27634/m.42846 type:complete len:1310 (+) Transcript_27634:227-4156(+)|eukprot:CAMPEP_0196802892 /NCGR_PEP_ID=MMETSP1362-20130617/2404_1 /TAXON_ID=163516 /ORGANISM="Leptocylindrus danicus, Strain CCMP1856" /LENGTH=1309 /DNA_ID=CAMNT_0042174295 /DNA_START=174 /DNA_END=4103 /DNA_ORIENTATION=+